MSNNERNRILNDEKRLYRQKGYIQLSTLMMLAFSSAFFSRVLTWIKFPSVVNLLHLIIVPFLCLFTLITTRVKDRKQIAIVQELLVALAIFLGVNLASAILNDAGEINILVNFLLFCEHFLLLIIIISIPLTIKKIQQFRDYLVFASLLNLFFAYVQEYILGLGNLNPDYIQGVFYESGAGHVVSASVSLSFGVYYFVAAKNRPLWLRAIVVLATFWQMNIADAKQVLLVFLVSGVLLFVLNLKKVQEAMKYLVFLIVLGYLLFWAIYNIPAFSGFLTWARPEIYGSDGEATLLKMATFRIVPTYYDSFLDPWFGLGPGHTVGRLGGWMLSQYWNLLEPLGATIHPASSAIWSAVGKSWLGNQSSMFSPLFGWAGIWGDLGFFGVASFIYIWSVVWRKLCFDDISRFFVINVFVFGLIFSQMEEPGYMLYIASILGLRWQEHYYSTKALLREYSKNNIFSES